MERLRHFYLRRIVAPVLRALGPGVSGRIARRVAAGVAELQTPGRASAEARIRAALGHAAGDAEIRRISGAMYDNIARFWSEALFVQRRIGGAGWRQHVAIEGEAQLESIARSGRGCLVATAYFGNPAVAAVAMGHVFRPIHVIADYLSQPQLRGWQHELYGLPQVRIIERHRAGAMIPKVLESGGAVFLICEQERLRGPAFEVSYLGRTLRCYPTLDRLSRWYDVPTVAVTCHRNAAPLLFTLEVAGIVECEREEGAVTRRTLAALEAAIVRRPEQYLWSMPLANQSAESITRRESESASCPRRSRTATGWQMPSAGDTRREDSAAATVPAPTA
jgi:lauroyl/myristoyl acyltransferase